MLTGTTSLPPLILRAISTLRAGTRRATGAACGGYGTASPCATEDFVHRAGGANGATWIVDYDDRTTADDEAGYRLDAHRFVEGEYVSIRDDAGELHTFVVNHVGKT